MKAALNTTERQVFEACKKAEGKEIENEIWFEHIDRNGLSKPQLKGYLSQLIEKGYLIKVYGEPTYYLA